MGRRALRKVDPNLDLSFHLRSLDDLSRPFSNEAVFGREAPLEVEMGSGKGLFLENAARGNPDHHFLGVELSFKYARFAAARLARHEIANGVMICGDGLRLFEEFLPSASLAAIHVYFPDPWWKKRHRRRRVLNEKFLGNAVRTLQPGARLHFWTDVREYFEATLELVRAFPELEGPQPVAENPAEHDLDYRTHFERRTRLNEAPVYRAEFVRCGSRR